MGGKVERGDNQGKKTPDNMRKQLRLVAMTGTPVHSVDELRTQVYEAHLKPSQASA